MRVVTKITEALLREFDARKAELYNTFIEGHKRGHRDSDGRIDTEEKSSCPFCKGTLKVGVDPNEARLKEDQQIGVYRGYPVFFAGTSYNCPKLKIYGERNDYSLKKSIDKKLGSGGTPNKDFKGFPQG